MKAEVRRRILVIAVGTVVALAVGYGFLPKPVAVDTAVATRGPLQVTVEEEGRTRVKDRFVVSSPVSGYLKRITLEAGDSVRKGQQLFVLEPLRSAVLDPRSRAEAEAAVAAAKAALDAAGEKARAASADAAYAREREKRMKTLAAGGYLSQDDIDQVQSEAKRTEAVRLASEAAVVAAKADLERAESVLRYSAARHVGGNETVIVRSPADGSVLKVLRESEGVVSAGDPILEVGNPRNMEVKAEVLSTDAVKLKSGTPVLFERWGGEKPLTGVVRIVEPAGFTKVSSLGVEEQRVVVIADITSAPELWEALGDGYRLDANFIVWDGRDVLRVPASALFRQGERWALFTVEKNRARLRQVEVGHRNGLAAEILSGLREGETLITHPDDTVREGVRVREQ